MKRILAKPVPFYSLFFVFLGSSIFTWTNTAFIDKHIEHWKGPQGVVTLKADFNCKKFRYRHYICTARMERSQHGIAFKANVVDARTGENKKVDRIILIMNVEGTNWYFPGWDIANDPSMFCKNCSEFSSPIMTVSDSEVRDILGDARFEFPDGYIENVRFLRIRN
jgi:hypothetical protein